MDNNWEDIDDDEFLRKRKHYVNIDDIKEKIDDTERRSLESTKRSLKYLTESEEVGIKTAEELVQNREQLNNVLNNLDRMSSDLKTSQKYVQSIRSVFSSFKNNIFRKKKKQVTIIDNNNNKENNLKKIINNNNNKIDSTKFQLKMNDNSTLLPRSRLNYDDRTCSNNPFPSQAIDDNLEAMSSALTRLKGLAYAMEEEIEQQNETVDQIIVKSAGITIELDESVKQVKKLL